MVLQNVPLHDFEVLQWIKENIEDGINKVTID
jgi:hypothetical protein